MNLCIHRLLAPYAISSSHLRGRARSRLARNISAFRGANELVARGCGCCALASD